MNRRDFIKQGIKTLAAAALFGSVPSLSAQTSGGIPVRALGQTGASVTLFGLGGEGVLRTHGRKKEAVKVISRALELGVTYCDTAPAYDESQDYYGEVLPAWRDKIFLASKTHQYKKEAALKLLKDSLRRLNTDHLDLWQIHDLRTASDLNDVFSKGGVIEAVEQAKKDGLIRFAGITGHHDPDVLLKAANEYPFDTALISLNAADRHYLPFMDKLLPALVQKKMGIIGMKVYARGRFFETGLLTPKSAMSYVLSLPVSNVIIGCSSPAEVEENVKIAQGFAPLSADAMKQLEERVRISAGEFLFYKR